jgi:hypothetical protein
MNFPFLKIQSGTVKADERNLTGNYVKTNNAGEVKSLFEFGANNSNVEWSHPKFSDGQNFVSTTYDYGAEGLATLAIIEGR